MIEEVSSTAACERFQQIAWDWLQSGEITRTGHLLSPLEELAGFNYGFVYLLSVPNIDLLADPSGFAGPQFVYKVGFSEHPMRRLRELQQQYRGRLSLRACFVGDQQAERFAHRRFASLRVKNELFYPHPIVDEYFKTSREQMRERIRSVHVCTAQCPQLRPRMDLRMLGAWLARRP